MSTYLKRTSTLIAAALLALAIGFGLASTQQAYAAEGGENLQAGIATQAVADLPYDGKTIGFFKEGLEEQLGMLTPQDKLKFNFSDGKLSITFTPSNSTIYHYFYLGGDVTDVDTWQDDKRVELSYDGDGVLTFTLDESYCGKATPVAIVRTAEKALKVIIDGAEKNNATTAQYYLAIPSKEQLLNPGIEGTAYVTIANNGVIATSDGVESGVLMSHVPVDLAEVSEVKLADYGMGDLERDVDGDGAYDVTMLHLFVYAHEKYFADKAGGLDASMTTSDWGTSLSITKFWGIPGTAVTYWLDDTLPMTTAESLALADGSDVDVYTYEYGSYYSDPNNYYFHFVDGSAIQGEATAYTGIPAEFTLHQHGGGFDENFNLLVTPAADRSVSYGKVYGTAEGTATADAEGKVTIEFAEPGTYYVWTDGLLGTVEGCEGKIVSAPACVTVDVKPTVINLTKLSQGLYKVNGYKVDSSKVYYDAEDGPAYLYVDGDKNATLVARLYNAKYTHVWKGEAADRPDASATDQMIAAIPIAARGYAETGAQREHVYADEDGSAYGTPGAVYKAVSFAIPVTAEDLANGAVTVCIRNADGSWMKTARQLQFESCEAVEGVDVSTWALDAGDIRDAAMLANAIPADPTNDDLEAYAEAAKAYLPLDYSGKKDYGRAYLDAVIPEVKAALDAADAAIDDVVPADGTYVFTQNIMGYASKYYSAAQPFASSDAFFSAIMTVKDGKMSIQVAQRRGSYTYVYVGVPSAALAAQKAAGDSGNDAGNTPGASDFLVPADVYLDNPEGNGATSAVDDSVVFGGPAVYPMYTGTIEIESLEKPVAISFLSKSSGTWFNRSFLFTQENMFTVAEAALIRPVNRLVNSPDPTDTTSTYDPYKVDPALISQDDIAAVEEAEEAYAALSADEKAKVDAMPIQGTPEGVGDAQTYPQALTAARGGADVVIAKAQETVNEAEAQMAISENMTPEQAEAAREVYDALSDYEKTIVSNTTNEFIAEAVVGDIESLPAKDSVTVNDEGAITKAREAYDALTPAQEAIIGEEGTNALLQKLTDAESALADAKEAKAKDDKDAADAAIAAIEKAAASGSAADVAAARAAYDALTDDQKKLVSDESVAALTAAEKKVAEEEAKAKAEEEAKAKAEQEAKAKAAEAAKAKITSVTVNVKTVNAKAVAAAIAKAGGDAKYVTQITLGGKVKKIAAKAFAKCPKVNTIVVKSKKLKKASVKGSLKGSKVKTVKVPKAKLKAYKKIFTKKVAGKKVSVKK